ncbi:hypothetical protein G5I_11361 [Acromyrmex echinatior]|uniref:Uncharacterized protein n=1 Tax=Acromyrmex echinatior TaxID=103372 RepID=F4WZD9_ACREC|nr:hypothetical protein G5I_11361 [Acromyrmex echinatior]
MRLRIWALYPTRNLFVSRTSSTEVGPLLSGSRKVGMFTGTGHVLDTTLSAGLPIRHEKAIARYSREKEFCHGSLSVWSNYKDNSPEYISKKRTVDRGELNREERKQTEPTSTMNRAGRTSATNLVNSVDNRTLSGIGVLTSGLEKKRKKRKSDRRKRRLKKRRTYLPMKNDRMTPSQVHRQLLGCSGYAVLRLKICPGWSYFDIRFVFSDSKYIKIAGPPLQHRVLFLWACVINVHEINDDSRNEDDDVRRLRATTTKLLKN